MANETIDDAWKDLRARVYPDVPEADAEVIRKAFYAGSWTTYLRFERAALLGPEAVHTLMMDTRAEMGEHIQHGRRPNP